MQKSVSLRYGLQPSNLTPNPKPQILNSNVNLDGYAFPRRCCTNPTLELVGTHVPSGLVKRRAHVTSPIELGPSTLPFTPSSLGTPRRRLVMCWIGLLKRALKLCAFGRGARELCAGTLHARPTSDYPFPLLHDPSSRDTTPFLDPP